MARLVDDVAPTSRWIGPLVLSLFAGGCQQARGIDAGEVSDPDAGEVARVAPPAAPRPPRWTCPAGWIEVPLEAGGQSCAPWAERPTCGAGEWLAPGRGCVALADDCGLDAPPELSDAMAFVRPGALDGDGSRARPFGTIREAKRAGHDTLALAPGEHVLDGSAYRGLALIGTCPTSTTLRVPRITVLEDSSIRRMRVTGEQLSVPPGRTLRLESVELAAMVRALQVQGTLRARRVSFRDLTEAAIIAFGPDAIELEDVSMERMPEALWVGPPETPSSARSMVSLLRVAAAEIDGAAFKVGGIAELALDEVVAEDAIAGILSDTEHLRVRDAFVRRITMIALGSVGLGERELARIHIDGRPRRPGGRGGAGVHLAEGTFTAEDLVILDAGIGFAISEGERGRVERLFVGGGHTYGIEVDSGELTLVDVRVAGVAATSADDGAALVVVNGAHATLERAHLASVDHFGLGVARDARLDAADLTVADVRSRVGEDGHGIVILDRSILALERARVERVGAVGLVVEDSSATAADLAIAEVRAPTGQFGAGLYVHATREGASVSSMLVLVRASLTGTHRAGALVFGPDAALRAEDLTIEDSRATIDGGIALCVMDGARAGIERFVIRGSALAGVLLGSEIDAELTRGRIEDGAIGLIASPTLEYNTGSTPGFSFRDVVLAGNEVDYQQTEAELPSPSAILF